MRVVPILIAILSCTGMSYGQQSIPRERLAQSTYYTWTGENGLVSNNITSAIQATSGFIWITTYNGIMRFDGTRVEVFDRATLPFLSTDAFYAVYEDTAGTLWFASQGSGLIRYRNNQFEPVVPANDSLPKSIRCLWIESPEKIWIGSNTQGLYKLEKNQLTHIDHPQLNDIGILDIEHDSQGNLWIATDGHGVFRYSGKTFTQFSTNEGLPNNNINSLEWQPNGKLLVGTSNGLSVIENNEAHKHQYLKDNQINYITTDAQGRIWIGTESGLGRMDTADSPPDFVGEETGAPYARINYISFDNEGSAWISTGRNGLVQLKPSGILNLTTSEGLSLNRVNVVTELSDNTFYIGTDNGHVNIFHEGVITTMPLKTSLNGTGVRDICQDQQGNFWIASYRGVLKRSGNAERLFTTHDGLPAEDIRRILYDSKGRLWFASRSAGLFQFRDNRVVRVLDKKVLRSNYILAMEESNDGRIYIGTHSGGLSIIQPNDSVENYSVSTNDAGLLIFNIHIDTRGDVFIVCNTGPYAFDGKKFTKLEIEIPGKGETYFDWLEDELGNVWITTNVGVLKLAKADVKRFLEGTISIIPTKLFDNQDGMKSKECTGATRSLVSSTGKLWIPTLGGVAIYYPDKIKKNLITPPVYVTSVTLDHETLPLPTNGVIEIPAGNLRIRINYTALSYLAPAKVHFKYQLRGVDREWVDALTSREAEYTNLSPGRYSFSVIASNNDGLWNQQGATITLHIRPHFYETAWFYVLSGIGIMVMLYGLYKWRVYRIEKRNAELRKLNEELDRFVYSTSHDLRAPLASIMGLINLSRLEKENKDQYIDLIEKSVTKLDQFIGEITDYSRNARLELDPKEIQFEILVGTILDDLKFLDEHNRISKSIEIKGTGAFRTDELRLTIVLNNLISNALKYHNPTASSPFVKISIEHSAQEAVITVSDNGIGISEHHVPSIFKMFYRGSDRSRGSGLGLYIVKETVDKLKGVITVSSVLHKGSTFTVRIPSL